VEYTCNRRWAKGDTRRNPAKEPNEPGSGAKGLAESEE
jgi:hypothetical protein